ncbi:MAG: hypothetical protein ACXVH3_32660 [Solirubrobacteraceae bacterium]
MAEATEARATRRSVSLDVERLELTAQGSLVIEGRWYGVRGRRFVRPALMLSSGGERRRLLADVEHKPWAAEEGELWLAAFPWSSDQATEMTELELSVAPDIVVPVPSSDTGAASRRPDGSRPRRSTAALLRRQLDGARTELAGERQRVDRLHADLERTQATKAESVEKIDELAGALDAALAERQAAIDQRNTAVTERHIAIDQRNNAVSERETALAERQAAIAARDQAITERDQARHAARQLTSERDQAVGAALQLTSERDQAVDAARQLTIEREQAVGAARQLTSERNMAITERQTAIAVRDQAITERDQARHAAHQLSSELHELRRLTIAREPPPAPDPPADQRPAPRRFALTSTRPPTSRRPPSAQLAHRRGWLARIVAVALLIAVLLALASIVGLLRP